VKYFQDNLIPVPFEIIDNNLTDPPLDLPPGKTLKMNEVSASLERVIEFQIFVHLSLLPIGIGRKAPSVLKLEGNFFARR